MVMRIDEAWHHHAAARIDLGGIAGVKVGADRQYLFAFDQNVGAPEIADLRVHRHHGAIADDETATRPPGVGRRRVLCGRRAQREKTKG